MRAALGSWCDFPGINLTQGLEVHPGAPAQIPHTDQAMWPFAPKGTMELCVNVFWPFVAFTEENGATRLWPDTHHRPRYAEVDPLNGAGRDAVLINADDAAEHHLMQGDRVDLVNERGRFSGRVFLAPIAPGNIQIHWPEGNHLLPWDAREKSSDTPDYNARVRLEVVREKHPAVS